MQLPSMLLHLIVIGISGCITLSIPENAYADDEFLQVYTEFNMPNNYKEHESGPVVGYATDLVREVLNRTGIGYDIQLVPWARAMQAIDSSSNVMVYSMARTAEREEKYHWIGKTLPLDFYLYGLRSQLERLPRTLEEAVDSRIGVVRADVVELYLDSKRFTNLIYVRDMSLSFNMLERDRIDLFPYTNLEAGLFAQRNGFDVNDLIGVIRLDDISNDLFMVTSKTTSASILEKLRVAYKEVVDSGRFNEIMDPLMRQYEAANVEFLQQKPQ